jgi:hypothetical protein
VNSVAGAAGVRQFTQEQLALIGKLADTDRQVRAHEAAHLAAAGPYTTGGPTYTYQTGPDGQLYAVGGEVHLNVSADPSDPQATIRKARVIEAAAEAPIDPSTQDRMVAAQATLMEADAERQLAAAVAQRVQNSYRSPAIEPGQLISQLG